MRYCSVGFFAWSIPVLLLLGCFSCFASGQPHSMLVDSPHERPVSPRQAGLELLSQGRPILQAKKTASSCPTEEIHETEPHLFARLNRFFIESFANYWLPKVAKINQNQRDRWGNFRRDHQIPSAPPMNSEARKHNTEQSSLAGGAKAALDKEIAFDKFFKSTPDCLTPANWEATVECGNKHAKARMAFEAQWQKQSKNMTGKAPGELK